MKNLILLFVFTIATITRIHAQTNKTLVKSVGLAGAQKVLINLPGPVIHNEWENDFVRITTYLKVDNMNENIVKQLVLVGRYNLEANLNEATKMMAIRMPKIRNQVRVKGIKLVEQLRFEVQVPVGCLVNIKPVAGNSGKEPSL